MLRTVQVGALKTVLNWLHCTFLPIPFQPLSLPSQLRTLITLLDSLLYHQCFAARNHSALRSLSARLSGNLASAPCLLYEHKTFPLSLSLLRLSLSQDHSSERSEAQITGTHHRYPLLIRNFISPNAGAGHIIMRRLSRTFAAS